MNDNTPDELLSAYLDGELTVEEQSQVERQLANSAELRQLLDELRAIRGGFESLPRYRLDDDFAARVLRRAEQHMLAPASAAAAAPAAAAASAPVAGDHKAAVASDVLRQWKAGGVRTWGWAAAAIAVGLVVFLFEQPRPEVPNQPAAAPAAPGDAHWIAVDQPRGDDRGDVAAKAAPVAGEGGVAGKADLGATAATGRPARGDAEADPFGNITIAPPGAAVPLTNAITADESKKETALEAAHPAEQGVDSDMLVVNCTVTREAAEQRQFDRLLNQWQIVMDDSQRDGKDVAQSGATAPTTGASPAPMMKSAESSNQSAAHEGGEKRRPAEGDVDAVVVDSTAGQITSVLADLNQNPKWFPSIQVDPAAPRQQSLTIYNRGAVQSPSEAVAEQAVKDKMVDGKRAPAGQAQMTAPPPDASAAKSAPTQFQAPGNLAGKQGILQQGRAKRLPVRSESPEVSEALRSRALSSDPNVASQKTSQLSDAATVEAARNLAQSLKPGGAQDSIERQFNARSDPSGNNAKYGNEEAVPVRALFLLRVVDTPVAVPAVPASPEMTK